MEKQVSKKVSKKTEEQVSNKVLTMFVTGGVLLWALSYLYKLFDYPTTYDKGVSIAKIVLIISAVGILCSAVWYIVARVKGCFNGEKIINAITVGSFFAVTAVSVYLLLYNYILGMKLVYVFVPAVVIYYLIYNVYQRAFFWLSVTHGFIGLVLYFMSNAVKAASNYVMGGICILVCAIAVYIGFLVSKGKGSIKLGKFSIRVFDKASVPDKKGIAMVYGITAAVLAVCMFVPAYLVMYAFYALAAFLVCCAVYFTVRLI